MRKIILYIAASLDGFIARTDDSIDWLEDEAQQIKGEDFGYSQFIKTIDTTLMGNNTYKVILGMDMPFPYTDKVNYVFSRSAESLKDDTNVKYVQEDVVYFVKNLKQQPGKDIWLIGGGKLNTTLLNAGLIDEMILTTIPIILGKGIPLFADGAKEKWLNARETISFKNGFVQTRYSFNN